MSRLTALTQEVQRIRALKRGMNTNFYDIGKILEHIKVNRLYEVKGYASFEAFLERELGMGKQISMRVLRIVQTFLKDAAEKAGLERVSAAIELLDDKKDRGSSSRTRPR